jgi:hypothetical protein
MLNVESKKTHTHTKEYEKKTRKTKPKRICDLRYVFFFYDSYYFLILLVVVVRTEKLLCCDLWLFVDEEILTDVVAVSLLFLFDNVTLVRSNYSRTKPQQCRDTYRPICRSVGTWMYARVI